YYNPQNATLVICGDINTDKILKQIEQYFSSISNQKNKNYKIKNPINFKSGNRFASFDLNVPSPAVFLAYHCPGFKEEDIYVADVLSFIAGTGRSSRLYKSLVYKNQIATQSSSTVDKRELGSLLIFYAISNNPDISCDKLYKELKIEIEKFKIKQVLEEELIKARNQLSTEAAYELQYSSGIADILANYTMFWGEPEKIYSVLDNYKKVNKEDIIQFANKILVEDNSIRIDAVLKK
ncbi:MAG: insulinase family protein, partial [FCB group bacterium]